jgi:hypothetical protein
MHRRTLLITGVVVVALIAAVSLLVAPGRTGSEASAVRGAPSATQPAASPQAGSTPSLPARAVPRRHPTTHRAAGVLEPGRGQRLFTLVNRTKQTIWAAAADDPRHHLSATGWRLDPGQSVRVIVPDGWNNRVWPRTGCSFDSRGRGHCRTGDCGGRFQCGRSWGRLPATLSEFNLNSWGGMDFYDVSLVDGNNVPMWINHVGGQKKNNEDRIAPNGCGPGGCTRDANATCLRVLQERAGGKVIDCRSSCLALGGDQYCCRGHWASRSACRPDQWPVDSAAIFKRAKPFAYSYVNDDATSMFVCRGECGYRITFGVTPGLR